MSNFWLDLPKPFFALAPMEDVTDTVCRRIVMQIAKPDVSFCEFTNVEGLLSVGGDKVGQRLKYEQSEKPLVAQLWGINPDAFAEAAMRVASMGFDGIDINLGCPERSVVKQGACSAMIARRDEAEKRAKVSEIIEAVKRGSGGLPVSVKTRIGISKIITKEWTEFLLEQGIAALTVHGRTVKEMSLVPCHWDEIAKVVQLRNSMRVETLVIGNGDVKDIADGRGKVKEFGVDGVMIGRGIFANPAAFDLDGRKLGPKERMVWLARHTELFDKTWGKEKNFAIMKKFVKMYVNGFAGAAELRLTLMQSRSARELVEEVEMLKEKMELE